MFLARHEEFRNSLENINSLVGITKSFQFGVIGRVRKLTFIENSNFFARLEDRKGVLWLVWGNPNQAVFSEARINAEKAIILRDFLSSSPSHSTCLEAESVQFEEDFLATRH